MRAQNSLLNRAGGAPNTNAGPGVVPPGNGGGGGGDPREPRRKEKKPKTETQVVGGKIAWTSSKLSEIMAWEAKSHDSSL